ncbi:MAG: FAD-dependent oxidoreductase [Pararhodobacter sp.]
MPFESPQTLRRRIAVIGGGISGMAAARLLSRDHAVTLIEAAPRLGGHARTVLAGKRGDQPVDTGFIVFNRANYPNLTALFEELDVPVTPSDMSFGVSMDDGRFEYALRDLRSLFATARNVVDPRFFRMLRDVLRFNARAEETARPGMTIGGLMDALDLGPWFRERYIQPFSGAIWSTPRARIMDFPARAMVEFFRNHALLQTSGQHQWFTVRGGSVEYVRRLTQDLIARDVEIRTRAPVAAVRREAAGVALRQTGGVWETFDEIVLAIHSDEALALLSDATPEERAALGAVGYQDNHAVLHCDVSVMPRRRRVWSSWTCTERGRADPNAPISLSYWMNLLQSIPQDDPMFVTLNGTHPIRDELIYDSHTFRHPVYDLAAFDAQDRLRATNGTRNTWFCGAWMRNGFHEDGFASAVDVVEAMERRFEGRIAA